MRSLHIVGCSGTSQIVSTLGSRLDASYENVRTGKFPNEEIRLQVTNSADTTILIGSLSSPVNTRIIEFLLTADAIKRMGCRNIIGVLTWYAYSKQDKVFLPGEPLSAKVIASLIQTVSIRELLCVELHNPSISGYFEIPVTNVSAHELFLETIKQRQLDHTVVVSPDAGSIKTSTRLAAELGLPIAYAAKQRNLVTGDVAITDLNSDISGKNVLLFDDMIATGSTLVETAEFLKARGALRITVCCTHHLYIPGVQERLDDAPIDELFVTNTIAKPDSVTSQKLKVVDIAPLLAKQLSHL